MATRKLKFDECIECALQRTSTCVRCEAGEFFEVKGPEEMNEEAMYRNLDRMKGDE